MNFEMFKCPDPECGYICISAADEPKCDDCKKPMVKITDPKERAETDAKLKKHFYGALFGKQ